MSFRFWRRIGIAPGVTLNLSKSGGSLSFGPRGAKFTIGPTCLPRRVRRRQGGKRATVGIPGTGLFYTTTLPSGRSGGRRSASYSTPALPTVRPEDLSACGHAQAGARPGDKNVCRKVVRLAEGTGNETPVHTALLLYKARALRGLGLLDAARETLTGALRRRKSRSEELLRALRYERALVYENLGKPRRARSKLEKLYAEAPDYDPAGGGI